MASDDLGALGARPLRRGDRHRPLPDRPAEEPHLRRNARADFDLVIVIERKATTDAGGPALDNLALRAADDFPRVWRQRLSEQPAPDDAEHLAWAVVAEHRDSA